MKLRLACLLSALSGFIALSYEIVWYRVLSLASRAQANAFGILLVAYLLGIAIGSFVARRWCPEGTDGIDTRRSLRALAVFILIANAVAYGVVPGIAHTVTIAPAALTIPYVTIATVFLGATFPLISHYGIAPDDRAGAGVSYVYAANIVGSTTGSLATGLVLMEIWGTATICVFLALAGLTLAAVVAWLGFDRASRRWQVVGVAAALGLVFVGSSSFLFARLHERLYYQLDFDPDRPLRKVVENRHGVVVLTDDLIVAGGGHYDGTMSTSLTPDVNGVFRPYLVNAVRERPQRALMIGIGSGSWAQVIVNNPRVEHLQVVEINPGYLKIIGDYPPFASMLSSPKMSVDIDDGCRWLVRHPDAKFDLIMSNTSYPEKAMGTHVHSREYHELIREHLNPGGLFLYVAHDSKRHERTGMDAWPYGFKVANALFLSNEPVELDLEALRGVLETYTIEGAPTFDLDSAEDRDALDRLMTLVSALLTSREHVLEETEGLAIVTDDNMGTEFSH